MHAELKQVKRIRQGTGFESGVRIRGEEQVQEFEAEELKRWRREEKRNERGWNPD